MIRKISLIILAIALSACAARNANSSGDTQLGPRNLSH